MAKKTDPPENKPRPWQDLAIRNGRTPLPERPYHRPWDPDYLESLKRAKEEAKQATSPEEPEGSILTRPRWLLGEIDLLMELREQGLSWEDVLAYFPNRTIHAVRQTWWKYRSLPREPSIKSSDISELKSNPGKRIQRERDQMEDIESPYQADNEAGSPGTSESTNDEPPQYKRRKAGKFPSSKTLDHDSGLEMMEE